MMRPADVLRLVLLGAIWGSSYLFIKVALEAFTPIQVVAGRMIAGALTLLLLLYARRLALPRTRRTWWLLAFMSVVANVVPFMLITWGEKYISSALASILNSTTPLFTALLAGIFIAAERLTLLRFAGVALGLAGVGVIVGVDASGGSTPAKLAMVLAAFFYGIGFVFSKRNLTGTGLSPIAIPAGQLIIGSIVTLPLATRDAVASVPDPGLSQISSVVALGVFGTGIAFAIYYRLIRDVGATTASLSIYLIPVFGAILGRLVLDEKLGWNALAGAALVVAGIALAEVAARRRGSDPFPEVTS
jgi:drug/metabolite transporter (DMT)-like permease